VTLCRLRPIGVVVCGVELSTLAAGQFQWSRVNPASGAQSVITGATRHQYAPEPADIGAVLSVTVHRQGCHVTPGGCQIGYKYMVSDWLLAVIN
jgi:hypothetical protein